MPEDNREFLEKISITRHEFTEETGIVKDNAQKIVEYLTLKKKINERGLSEMNVKVFTVLGDGEDDSWPGIWRDGLNSVSTPDLEIKPKTIAFDYDKNKIKRFREENPELKTLYIMLGDDAGNDKFAEVLESWKPDILFISNIGDWLLRDSVEDFVEVLEVKLPPVIVFSGTRTDTQFGALRDALIDLGYDIKSTESGREKLLVKNQAIATLKLK